MEATENTEPLVNFVPSWKEGAERREVIVYAICLELKWTASKSQRRRLYSTVYDYSTAKVVGDTVPYTHYDSLI